MKPNNLTSFDIFNFDKNQEFTYQDFSRYQKKTDRYVPSLEEFNDYKELCRTFHTYKGEYKIKPEMHLLLQNRKLGDVLSMSFKKEQTFNNECLISVQMCNCCSTTLLWFGSQLIGNDSVFVLDPIEVSLFNRIDITAQGSC